MGRILDAGTILLLPALAVYLGLNAGGYFALETGWAAAALAGALALRIAVSGVPSAARSVPFSLAAGGLAIFAIWTLLSETWSGNQGRALIEFDRALLYLLALLVFGSIQDPRAALRHLPAAFALSAVFLCAVGLATRTLPELWPFAPPAETGKLAYPVTYSNGLGILASLAIVLCLHLASWGREFAVTRILAAAALPLLAATLTLTQSEGALAAGAIGAFAYAVFGRPWGLVTSLLAGIPFVVLAVTATAGADLLLAGDPETAAALDEGRALARTVGLAMAGAGTFLAILLPVERRLARRAWKPPRPILGVIAAVLAIAVGAAAATQLPGAVRAIADELEGAGPGGAGSRQGALRVLDGQNRIDYWRVALDAFEEEPITGTGVGTFANRWAQDRPFPESVSEGHSVYVETLGELGLVGAGLLVLVLVLLTTAFVVARRRVARPLGAVALGTSVAWLLHAGIDWDWELPVLTVWLFAFGGCALAAWPKPRVRGWTRSPLARAPVAVACLLLAVTPVTVAVSQSRLDGAVSALLRKDCAESERLAAAASRTLPVRAEPYELLAYCASRRGAHGRAISMMREAIDRDPESWKLTYGLALVRAAAGEDPRPAARRAFDLNPLEGMTNRAMERFAGDDPRRWRYQARHEMALPLP